MKTYTIVNNLKFSTEQLRLIISDEVKVILLHCVETPLDKNCECSNQIFDSLLDYETFKEHHYKVLKNVDKLLI
jgi:hypothetical protein